MSDLIDRQKAIDAVETKIKKWNAVDGEGCHVGLGLRYTDVINTLTELPSAQPERKTGHWLIREGISDARCSECGMYFIDVYDMENSDAFCRHCGTKMEGLKVVKRG